MAVISTNDFHNGLTIELDGTVYQVVDFQHSKTGRGGAFVRSKLKNVEDGGVIEKTFRANEKVNRAHVEQREKQYLYRDGDDYIFMDTETYEQIALSQEQLGEKIDYLKENMVLEISVYEGRPIDINLPTFVELAVAKTQPGIKGNTVSGGSKPATLESGAVVQVPLFISEGDIVKVDTRTGEYMERV
ncbi:elongation factor P [Halocella sp. SP3-1]|uniref:elongation factor P n=1 Tax=Halocella sp. SP3-1 TaxID=2382161 RepID=UPI000F7619B2|nr:elongation factor P [Halocella sp. SP3-1]AZO95675.1 elongation factor P [Halocella sp. SP3-1]